MAIIGQEAFSPHLSKYDFVYLYTIFMIYSRTRRERAFYEENAA